ncbi:MAG: GDSL-type esterase/lipase family protein [Planctomycetia bacterium]|nr:GDSL-type esterase/lipase family protein [Planctomycetia bacterium]
MSKRKMGWVLILLCFFQGWCQERVFGERVIVIGDSITGQSMNLPCGYTHEVRKVLADAHRNDFSFIPLGGSGSTVRAWHGFLENSYQNRQQLDIRGIFIKDELDQGADTIFLFLGMNDALCPTMETTEEGFARWKKEYQTLLDMLRKRTSCKRLVLCPPTMLTETPFSYKNQVMDRMSVIMADLARENQVEFLDTRGEFQRHFLNARLTDVNFCFTPDCVHPGTLGHSLLAWMFLKKMGLREEAQNYYETKIPDWMRDFERPGLSLFVQNSAEPNQAMVKGFLRGGNREDLQVQPPEGWKLERLEWEDEMAFTLFLSGHCQKNSAPLEVSAGEMRRSVLLNAPFYVAASRKGPSFANPDQFDAEKAKTEVDTQIVAGKSPWEVLEKGKPISWLVYYPTRDLTGRDDPNAIDFCSISNGNPFEFAYVARKIHSPRDQEGTLKINALSFSTTAIATLYWNGQEVYQGCVSPRHVRKSDEVSISLKKGENILFGRIHHSTWQWAVSLEIVGEGVTF